jgi:hypothetical protein
MLGHRRQTRLVDDQPKTITAANVADVSPVDVHPVERVSPRTHTMPRDGDDRVALFLAPGQWPRVFPGL